MTDLLRSIARFRDKFTKSKFEQDLHKATSNEEAFPDESILREVAIFSYTEEHYQMIIDHIFKKLQEPKDKWRKIIKALQLVEYIIKDGNSRFIRDLNKNLFVVRSLEEFNHFVDNSDKGKPIRSLARRVSELISEGLKNIETHTVNTNRKVKETAAQIKQYAELDEEDDPNLSKMRQHMARRADDYSAKEQVARQREEQLARAERERMKDSKRVQESQIRNSKAPAGINPNIYNDPHADKEVLDLVQSQFGQGFLELEFDDDPQTRVAASKPSNRNTTNQAQKKPEYPKESYYPNQSSYQGPGANNNCSLLVYIAPPLDFDNFQSDFSTSGKRNSKPTQPVNVKPQEKPNNDIFSGGRIEFDDDFSGFNEFNVQPKPSKPKPTPVRIDQPVPTQSTYVGGNQREINFDDFNQFGSNGGMNGGFGTRSAPKREDPFFTDARPVQLNNDFFGSAQPQPVFQEPVRQSPQTKNTGFGDDFLSFDLAGTGPSPARAQQPQQGSRSPNTFGNEFQFL